jgi:hypothetical protein
MLRIAQRARFGEQLVEQCLALHERQRPQVEPLERHEIEEVHRRGVLDGGVADIRRPGNPRPVLEPLKARPPLLVQDHQLTVHHKPIIGQGLHRTGELRERRRVIVAVAGDEARDPALACHAHAISVELHLEHPAGTR